jgi:hypothetical protein
MPKALVQLHRDAERRVNANSAARKRGLWDGHQRSSLADTLCGAIARANPADRSVWMVGMRVTPTARCGGSLGGVRCGPRPMIIITIGVDLRERHEAQA